MEYLKLFENHSEYETFVSGDTMVKPNVSHCIQENKVHYNPKTWADEYLTFDILSAGTIVWKASTTAVTVATISYKLNDGDWTEITSSTAGTSFNVSDGDKVIFKGENATYSKQGLNSSNFPDFNTFSGSTASFNIKGNIMSLISGDSFANVTTLESAYTFISLFRNTNVVSAENLMLPATTLTVACYFAMFSYCKSLTTTPELPATTLNTSCYGHMFSVCSSLTKAPSVLPATTLNYCCYLGMFGSCPSLTKAPDLPATTLASSCYSYMFDECTSLNYVKAMFTTTPSTSNTYCFLRMVASSGTFVKNSAATWTDSAVVPNGWTVETATE